MLALFCIRKDDFMDKLPKRTEIDVKYAWHLEDIYSNLEKWEQDFCLSQKSIENLNHFSGKISTSAQNLLDCLKENNETSLIVEKLYVYASMRFHEDSTNATYQKLSSRAETLLIQYSAAASFIIPEILAIPEQTLLEFRKQEDFSVYTHVLDNILRQKEHTLSVEQESLLAQVGELGGAPQNIFTMLNDADIKFSSIKNEKGEEVELTKGRYTSFLENKDRRVRKDAFTSLYASYFKQKNTIAATYSASVKSDVFFAKARNYPSALAAALEDDNIPLSVYDNLIETVHKILPLLHRYVALRKKLLHLDEIHMYDLYVPIVTEADKKISYEEAKQTVSQALNILGEDYTRALQKGLNSGWIDVYENEGKRSGAYSWGIYGVHPYVLLNHNDNINSMFTLAHEMGHALHSYFSWEKQPYLYSGHKIFVAEVASTCNEALLMHYLLEHTEDIPTKKYLINYFMEQFRGTLFRQTMFAEFEKITHDMAEKGEPLTYENMSQIYYDLNKQYFGDDIVIDEDIAIEWARIPHFYNAFYVYQYATGYSAAIALSQKITNEGQPAIDRYLNFLSKGNSEYSIDLLKGAGVDMTTTAPIENAMSVFENLLDQLENL